jgi:glycosyltransferase involved in cell wall biosynthesis
MRVCFFARVLPKSSRAVRLEALQLAEFYRQDIDILRELGFEVTIATAWAEIPSDVDFYFIWWWQWAFLPMWKSIFHRRPCLVTGTFDFKWAVGRGDYFHRPAWQQWLMRYALKRAAANVFVSELECREISRALTVTNPLYIPHVVDTGIFQFGTQPREDFALTVARMDRGNSLRKCIPEIIRAVPLVVSKYSAFRFIIAGEKGSDFPALQKMAQELRVLDRVEFPGVISREHKIELMQRCKIYVSPSWYEGFGLTILEAMSCGAPVISSPVGGVPEVVGDEGLLVDGTSPEAIAAAVSRYLADDALREEVGRRARLRAESVFPYSRRKRDLEKVISNMLARA